MPDQPNYSALGQGLKLYDDAMRTFIKHRLIAAMHDAWWRGGVLGAVSRVQSDNLKREAERNPGKAKEDFIEPGHMGQIVGKQFNQAFKGAFTDYDQTMAYMTQVATARNQHSHPKSGDLDAGEVTHSLYAIVQILRMADLPEAAQVETLRQRLIGAGVEPPATVQPRRVRAAAQPAKAGQLPYWWQAAEPHDAFKNPSQIDESLFAATLGGVHAGAARQDFLDPEVFLAQTYFTANLVQMVRDVAGRLNGGPGAPVTELQTPFGGGKTHAMLTLYHLGRNPAPSWAVPGVQEALGEAGRFPADTRVVVFDGNERGVEPSVKEHGESTATLWGELAWQLDRELFIKEIQASDDNGTAPGNEVYRKVLHAGAPCIILIDELVSYLVKLKFAGSQRVQRQYRQTIQFVQELLQEAGNVPGVCVVLSLPKSQAEFGGIDPRELEAQLGVLPELQARADRVVSKRTPVDDAEIYTLMRKRLFKHADPAVAERVARAYRAVYERDPQTYDQTIASDDYLEQLVNAWPLHPELIDVLYKKWSTATDFPRTRTVLQLMASVVADQWTIRREAHAIQSGHVNLERDKIRSKIVSVTGSGYDAVVAADIIGGDAHADHEDERRGGDYARFHICRGIATSLLMHSFGGRTLTGALPGELQLSIVAPNIGPEYVSEVLESLEQSLWYVRRDGELLRFQTKPNIYRVIAQQAGGLAPLVVSEALQAEMHNAAGSAPGFRLLEWAGGEGTLPDSPNLTIAILEPRYRVSGERAGALDGQDRITTLWERAGGGLRRWRNSLILIAPDADLWQRAEEAMREVLAYKQVIENISGGKTRDEISTAERKDLDSRHKDKQVSLRTSFVTAYRWVFYPDENGLTPVSLTVPATRDERITRRAVERLSDQTVATPKIFERLSAAYFDSRVLPKVWRDEDSPLELAELSRRFKEWTYLPVLLNEREALRATIREGVGQDRWAVAVGDNTAGRYRILAETPEALAELTEIFDGTASLVRGAFLELIREQLKPVDIDAEPAADDDRDGSAGPDTDEPQKGKQEPVVENDSIPRPTRHRRVALTLDNLPISKTGNLQPYVFRFLQQQDPGVRLRVTITAESDSGLDAALLDSQIVQGLEMLDIHVDWKPDV